MTRFPFKNAWRSLLILSLTFGLAFTARGAAIASPVGSLDDFIITVKTDNSGTSEDTQFTIPTTGSGYNYNVDCGDGSRFVTGQTTDYTCDYASAGTYTIRIKDNSATGPGWAGFPRIYFFSGGDNLKLLTIEQWGTGAWTSMAGAFYVASNMTQTASDAPDLSGVADMSNMFYGAAAFNGDISGWDTSNVTDMRNMFNSASSFNQDISVWDTAMVTDMNGMFTGASVFNGNISGWDTSSVTDMAWMFNLASVFNGNISGWDTSNVTSMYYMFGRAYAFNQDLGNWVLGALTNAAFMFTGVTLSKANYDSLLNGWNAQALQSGVTFDGGDSLYCSGAISRSHMIGTDSWTITDGGIDCPVPVTQTPSGEISDKTPTYTWDDTAGATYYQFQLFSGTTLVDLNWVSLSNCTASSCSFSPAQTLKLGIYKWRLRARNGIVWGDWSSFQRIRVMNSLPALISPNGNISDTTPRFFWTNIPGATRYQIQINQGRTHLQNRALSSKHCGVVNCSTAPSQMLDFSGHQWRIRTEVGGVWEAWTDYTNFTVVP